MAEKTMVTIDCDLIIPEGAEKVFENQHIMLEAGIKCNGKLIFKDCEIEPIATQSGNGGKRRACKPGCIEVSGTMEMAGCEVIRPGRGFLSFDCEMNIKNTSFLKIPCSDSEIETKAFLTQCVIIAREKVKFEGCSFVGETGNAPQTSELALIKSATVIMDNCTFENITGKIEVDTISGCSFTGCAYVNGTEISGTSFTDCGEVSADNGYFRNCDFTHVSSIDSSSSDMDNCRFRKIESDSEYGACIYITDCKIRTVPLVMWNCVTAHI